MIRSITIFGIAVTFVSLTLLWFLGGMLISPAFKKIESPPVELAVKTVEFEGTKGWLIRTENINACIVLMHGVRSNRSSMLNRARFLKEAGYTSLLFDFQAHGESLGQNITFGYRESINAHSAVRYLKSNIGCHRIGAIGQSLGGAASLLGEEPLEVDALVLESVYSTIEDATSNRLEARVGAFGRLMTPLLTYQIPLRLNISLNKLRPIDAIKNLKAPVLVLIGSQDRHTTVQETEQLFKNAPGQKELWIIKGAKHVDLHGFDPQNYEKRILKYFKLRLGGIID